MALLHQLADDFDLLGRVGFLQGHYRFEMGELAALTPLGQLTLPSR